MSKKRLIVISTIAVVAVGGLAAYLLLREPALPPGFAGGNGRLEAKEIDISTKYPGRIKQILVNEGDEVESGQVVAIMDTEALEAQLRAALAQITGAEDNRRIAQADVRVKQTELSYATTQYKRAQKLVTTGAVSQQERDVDQAKAEAALASLEGARVQTVRAQSAIDAATAESERLKAQIADNTLRAPLRARVETRVAEPGEVLPSGGKVLTVNDLSDVYMYIFLPTASAGKVALGDEARIMLDAMPGFPVRAVVTYVSPTAQFTPKTVETAQERADLSFRVKLQLDKVKLREYERYVKAGIPGMGYVRFDNNAQWPEQLQFKPVSEMPWKATGSAALN